MPITYTEGLPRVPLREKVFGTDSLLAVPFSLAHPAVALAFRRPCRKYLGLSALVIGSLVPDTSYCLPWKVSDFAHGWVGSLAFCLIVGLPLLYLFYGIRAPLATLLPPTHGRALEPLCRREHGTLGHNVLFLVLGAWSHVLWDSFTHEDGWLVNHVNWLQTPLFSSGRHEVQLCRVLWLLSSGLGMLVLLWAYLVWLKRVNGCVRLHLAQEWPFYLLGCAIVGFPALGAIVINLHRLKPKMNAYDWYNFIHWSLAADLVATTALLVYLGLMIKRRGRQKP